MQLESLCIIYFFLQQGVSVNFLIRNIFASVFVFGIQATVIGMDIPRKQENVRVDEAQEKLIIMQNKAEQFRNEFYKQTSAAQDLVQTDPFVLYCLCPNGDNPIHVAVARKNPVIVEWLLVSDTRNGVTNLKNRNLETPLTMLVNDSVNLRLNDRGFSSSPLQKDLIYLVGEKCTLQELEKNLVIAQGIACKSSATMSNLIKISTIDPLKELIEKKTPKAPKRLMENNKRKQHPTQSEQGNTKKQKIRSQAPMQLEQGKRMRYKGVSYEYMLVDDENNLDHMVEVSDTNILPVGTKRLRKSTKAFYR